METTTIQPPTTQPTTLQTMVPQKEHQWLQQLVGEWRYETEAIKEDGSSEKAMGTETVRSLGEFWVVAEGEMACQGEMAKTMMTLGYEPYNHRYVGSWVGSMMPHFWCYEGELDIDESVLTLTAEGPNMSAEGTVATYRDTIELKSAEHRVMVSHMLGDDGKWQKYLTVNYRRV